MTLSSSVEGEVCVRTMIDTFLSLWGVEQNTRRIARRGYETVDVGIAVGIRGCGPRDVQALDIRVYLGYRRKAAFSHGSVERPWRTGRMEVDVNQYEVSHIAVSYAVSAFHHRRSERRPTGMLLASRLCLVYISFDVRDGGINEVCG